MGVSRRIGFLLFLSSITCAWLFDLRAHRAQAQEPPPGLVWESRYNRSYSEDLGKAVVTDPAGNIYVTGAGYGYLSNPDYLTVKYDPSGAEVWKALYGSSSLSIECRPYSPPVSEIPADMGIDGTGNVYVTGISAYAIQCGIHGTWYPHGSTTTVKYDPDGTQVWVEDRYGEAAAMAVNEDGAAYVTGTAYESDGWGYKTPVSYVTAKFDTFGQKHWSITYEGPTGAYNYATDIALDDLGFIHVTGHSQGTETDYDYATIMYSRHGQEMRVNRYDGPAGGDDRAESIFANAFGEVCVTGSSEGTGTDKDFATVKYDLLGNQAWVARYNGPADGSDEAVSRVGDEMGNVFVTGTSEGLASGTDIVAIAYDSLGNQVWEQRYDGPANGSDSASSVTITSAGNVVVTGKSEGSVEDFVTICYGSSSGVELWLARYNGPASGSDYA